MSYIDLIILGVIVLSALISVLRGFVKEAVSLVSWILAFWVAASFAGKLALLLPDFVRFEQLRLAIGFAGLFLLTLLVGGLANFLISSFVSRSGLGGTDRSLGVVFGTLRGVVVVAVLVMLAGLTQLTAQSEWRNALLVPYFEVVAVWIRDFLPEDVAHNFNFGS